MILLQPTIFMNRSFLLTLLCSATVFTARAQSIANPCASAKQQKHQRAPAQRGTIADPREENYDMRYIKLDIALTNTEASISGNALTHAVTKAPMSSYVFELTNDLTVDSVKIDGMQRTFTHAGEVGVVTLPAALAANTMFEAQVFYHGTVNNGSGFFARGLRNVLSGAAQRRYTFTLGEPYAVKDWWPCKQALQDKIDSADIWITVADSLKAGSNGLLQQVTPLPGRRSRYEWKNSNPINYYLISASVGAYNEYSYYMHFNNSTDSMLIQNYLSPNSLTQLKPVMDSIGLMINYYSSLFGRYPFWKEKYGHCQAPLGGGEEHQTMTTIGIFSSDIVPHELAHQWWGDHVTCGTWKDIWLNEGLATYAEYLHVEHFSNADAANKMLIMHYLAMHERLQATPDPTGAVYVDDTTDEERIFSSRLSYNKGGAVAHMLRFEAGNDSLFFTLLRTYQQQFANGTATTAQLNSLATQIYGRNMDTFFNQWVYSSGWPKYDATWNQKNGIAIVQLNQTATGNYTAHKYSTPLEIKFTGPQGDTTIRVYTSDAATTFAISRTKPVTGIVIDPNNWLLDEAGLISRNNSLGIGGTTTMAQSVYPNPVHDFLTISGSNGGILQITDVTGKLLLQQQLTQNTAQADMRTLAPGLYLYRILKDGLLSSQGKIVKH
jgi:aminopeptidase N